MPRATCTVVEAAQALGVSTASAYRHVKRTGEVADGVSTLHIGRRLVVPIIALEAILGPLPHLREPRQTP